MISPLCWESAGGYVPVWSDQITSKEKLLENYALQHYKLTPLPKPEPFVLAWTVC